MDREAMRMAVLKQEQTFRQQVQDLHRVYHVQKQLMREMQVTIPNAQAIAADIDRKPKQDILRDDNATNHLQSHSFSNSKSPASADDCNLELTLATGSSSSSSRGLNGKRVKSSNSDSGTAVSSTSTESEPAVQFKEPEVTAVRFQRLADELSQPPWLHQRLSLRMA